MLQPGSRGSILHAGVLTRENLPGYLDQLLRDSYSVRHDEHLSDRLSLAACCHPRSGTAAGGGEKGRLAAD
jgi:hypothetical protein